LKKILQIWILGNMFEIIFLLGVIVGVVFSYFVWIKPLTEKERDLLEAVHDCIKAGLVGKNEEEE
jgi:hypothetical protein